MLTFTDAGISSDTGVAITFDRDSQGRIEKVIDPAGNEIAYTYDAVTGDLTEVLDRESNRTEFKYHAARSHYLEEIIDPLMRPAARAEYDETTGRLAKIFDVGGDPVEFEYDPASSVQVTKDANGVPTIYEYDM